MDIVNKGLPRGNKFYPVEQVLRMPLEHLLNRENIAIIREAADVIQLASANSDYWSMCHNTHGWVIAEGTDKYPVIEMPYYNLRNISYHFGTHSDVRKANYTSATRIGHIGAAVTDDTIKIQYDPIRGGLWFFDVEYEGDLLSNKPMVINKNLKSAVRTKIGELALEALLGAGEEDLIIDRSYYDTKAHKAEKATAQIVKILSGDYETHELASCAVNLGIYGYKYSNTVHKYVIDLDTPGTEDFDITSSARTKLIYLFGGYELPDDYQDWFDKT